MKFSWKETVSAFSEIYELDIKDQINKKDRSKDTNIISSNPITIGYLSNEKKINEILKKADVKIDKIDVISRNIIRTFITTILLGEDKPLAISRAIRISEKFSSPKSYKFIHAIISKIMENLPQNL